MSKPALTYLFVVFNKKTKAVADKNSWPNHTRINDTANYIKPISECSIKQLLKSSLNTVHMFTRLNVIGTFNFINFHKCSI